MSSQPSSTAISRNTSTSCYRGILEAEATLTAQVYGAKIRALADSLNNEETKGEAIELLRGLVSEVRLHPDENAPSGHLIELYGELAAILELSGPRNDKTRRVTGGVSVSLVAGGRAGQDRTKKVLAICV